MSRVLTASDICARSLRTIGKFPVTESAPDGEDLREAMHWLDLILGETVGTERMFSRLSPGTLSVAITNGTQSYNLYTALGSALPTDRVQFVVAAWLEDQNANRSPIEIVTEEKFEDVSKLSESGTPTMVHIDRQATPTLRIYPTPATTDSNTYTLKLVCQRYAPNVAPGGVTGTTPSGSVLHDFGQAWQRWMVCQLAHDLGSGPIHKIGEATLNRFALMAGASRARLLAFENREHETTDPICEPAWEFE